MSKPRNRTEYMKAWRAKNKQHVTDYKRDYEAANPHIVKAQRQRTYQNNREAALERERKYRTENKQAYRAYQTAYQKMVRRPNEKGAEGSFTIKEWSFVCRTYNNRCVCCGSEEPLTIDHVKPLSKGGSNYIENIQPLCRSCNSSKGDKEIDYRPY
jgi:5-methylcytosine-specific restriction endonuclease McrA